MRGAHASFAGLVSERHRASAVCEAEEKLLLVRLRDPVSGEEALYPPGGAIEEGEAPSETARREVLEETGVAVVVDPNVVLVERYPFTWAGTAYDVTTHYFYATTASGQADALSRVSDADYNLGAVWLPVIEALDALAVHPAIASAVARVLQRKHLPEWLADPRLGGGASMLLAIHDQFRRATDFIETLDDPDAIRRAFAPLGQVLHHHHHTEEVILFPRLAGSERLEAEHVTLTQAIDAVRKEPSKETFARFATVLRDHLVREELEVVPFLLAHGEGFFAEHG